MAKGIFRAHVCALLVTSSLASAGALSTDQIALSTSNPLDQNKGVKQAEPTQSGEQDSDKKATQLEEITVTATRREESIEKVPASIEALSQQDILESGIKNIADIAAVTPGLQFAVPGSPPSTFTTISIRGMDTNVGASVVGIYLDDTPLQARLSFNGNVGNPYPIVFDLNRVEVERGPQGTLFGAGSEAGTVRYITNQPSLTEFSGFSHAEMAWTQAGAPSYEIGAAVGGPIVADKIGFRVSVWDRRDGGYVDRIDPITGNILEPDANSDDKLAIKAALAFQANEALLITPSIFYQRIHQGDSGFFQSYFSDPSTGHFNNGEFLAELSTDRFVLPALKIQAHLPFAELTSNTSYTDRRADVTVDTSAFWGALGVANYGSPLGPEFVTSPSDVAPSQTGLTQRAFTEEVRLASNQPGASLTWVAGIFYDHRKQTDYVIAQSLAIDPTGANIFYSSQPVTDNQIAAFAQGDFHFTSKLTATLGVRVARVKTDQQNFNGPGVLNAGEPAVAEALTLRETPFTPKLALSYQADPNNLYYISASKGFRVGGGNTPLPSFCNTSDLPSSVLHGYKSDYDWSYEIGAKNKLLDGRVQIDSSVFHVDWSKIQQFETLQCGFQYIANAGSAVSNGFDLALHALVTEQLRVNINLGYANAYFTSNLYGGAGQPLVLSGDKIGFPPAVNAPWNVDTSANYEIPLPQGDKLHLRGEYQYNSRNPGPFVTQLATSPNYYPGLAADPPTHLFKAALGYTKRELDLTLFVDNVFNSAPLLGKYKLSSLASEWATYSTFRPRTVGLSANYSF